MKDRSYYTKESENTKAYKKFMLDFAQKLNGDKSIQKNDVDAMFQFEKEIAKVNLFYSLHNLYPFFIHSIIGPEVNKVFEEMKPFTQHLVI